MFVSVMEPALLSPLNSSFPFLFCNLIILLIILSSKFRSSNSETKDALPGLRGYRSAKWAAVIDVEQGTDQIERASCHPEKQVEEKLVLEQVSEVCNSKISRKEECELNSCEYKNEDRTVEYDYEAENKDNGEEDNGDDGYLRMRSDDFISKVNRELKAENLKDRKLKPILLDQPLAWITQEAEKQVEEKLVLEQVSEVCNSEISGKEECELNSCEYKNEVQTVEYDYEAENEDNGEEDNRDAGELRRRFDDFITKFNRELKAENLKDRKLKPLLFVDQPLAWITQEA